MNDLNAHISERLQFCWRSKMWVCSWSKHGRLQSLLEYNVKISPNKIIATINHRLTTYSIIHALSSIYNILIICTCGILLENSLKNIKHFSLLRTLKSNWWMRRKKRPISSNNMSMFCKPWKVIKFEGKQFAVRIYTNVCSK